VLALAHAATRCRKGDLKGIVEEARMMANAPPSDDCH
jgi:hypothetical protein